VRTLKFFVSVFTLVLAAGCSAALETQPPAPLPLPTGTLAPSFTITAMETAAPSPTPRPTRTPPPPTATRAPTREVTWVLDWADEFDVPGLPDPAHWNYEEGLVRNNESQYYTRERLENARVENGSLVIEGRKEAFEGAEYTSASLVTHGKHDWAYGRVEVRAKLPTGVGTWPAIWLLGSSIAEIGWPDCGEIDIMENVGYNPDMIYVNIHTKSYNHVLGTNKGGSLYLPKPYADFHIYALNWYPDRLDFFVDDELVFTYYNEGTGTDVWPYDAPHYLILNLAIGGSWGGTNGVDEKIFPQQMLVDYVRVYQAQP
jgi:beta-glucanase (GH16 family)